MKPKLELVFLFMLIALMETSYAQEWKPVVLIYSREMPGFAEGIAGILRENLGEDVEFEVVEDPSLFSSCWPCLI